MARDAGFAGGFLDGGKARASPSCTSEHSPRSLLRSLTPSTTCLARQCSSPTQCQQCHWDGTRTPKTSLAKHVIHSCASAQALSVLQCKQGWRPPAVLRDTADGDGKGGLSNIQLLFARRGAKPGRSPPAGGGAAARPLHQVPLVAARTRIPRDSSHFNRLQHS